MHQITLSDTVAIKPFSAPNYAVRAVHDSTLPNIDLRDIPADTLAAMADEWRVALFAKAGKVDPKESSNA